MLLIRSGKGEEGVRFLNISHITSVNVIRPETDIFYQLFISVIIIGVLSQNFNELVIKNYICVIPVKTRRYLHVRRRYLLFFFYTIRTIVRSVVNRSMRFCNTNFDNFRTLVAPQKRFVNVVVYT